MEVFELKNPSGILKTFLYIDNINAGEDIVDHLASILHKQCPDTEKRVQDNAICLYNATFTLEYQTATMKAFHEGTIQVMVCTEAAGMVST